MAKNSFLDWDTTASNNTDIGGTGILGTNAVSNFDDAFRTLMAQLRSGVDGKVVYAAKSGNYTAVANDNNAWHRYTANATVSLTAAATLAASWHYFVQADGGTVTIDPNGAELINGASTLVLQSGQTAAVICTGTAFFAIVGGTPISGPAQQGYLYGLTLANNGADATNDIDIAVGAAAADTSPYYLMQLTSGLTKRLDAAWAVGSGNGGLDTGSIANTTYHIWLIQRSDTGVVDALFSTSATSPTMPTNYDRKRRIGSILRSGAAIFAFRQVGDRFMWGTSIQDVNVSVASASALQGFTAPLGFSRRLILALRLQSNGSTNTAIQLGDAAAGSANTSVLENLVEAGGTEVSYATIEQFFSNTSSQLYMAVVGNAPATFTIRTMGWVDTRGKE